MAESICDRPFIYHQTRSHSKIETRSPFHISLNEIAAKNRTAIAFSLRNAIAFTEQPIQICNTHTGTTVKTLESDRPYEGMNITGVTGISEGQKVSLKALGAIEV